MKQYVRSALILALLVPQGTFAAWGGSGTSGTNNTDAATSTGSTPSGVAASPGSLGGVSSASPEASNAVQRNSQGVYNQADKASKSSGAGQLLGLAAAAVCGYLAIGYCSDQEWAQCAMSVAGVIAGYSAATNMSKSKNNAEAVRDMATVNPNFDPNAAVEKLPEFKPLAAIVDQLEDKGVKVNLKDGKFKTPNGQSYSSSDFSSPAAMKAAGFNEDQIAKFGAMMKSASAEAEKKVAALGGGDFGGGGGGAAAARTLPPMPDMEFKLPGEGGIKSSRDPAQVAGLSRNFNGEPIGISADSIFLMMNRRYNLKAQQHELLTGK